MTFEYLELLYAAEDREKVSSILKFRRLRIADRRMRSQITSQSRAASNSSQYGLYRNEISLLPRPSESHDFMISQSLGNVPSQSRRGCAFHKDHEVWKAACSPVP